MRSRSLTALIPLLAVLILAVQFWNSGCAANNNPANPPPTATPTPPSLTISSGSVTLNTGDYTYSSVNIQGGTTLVVNGAVTLEVQQYFNLAAGATIFGDGFGYGLSQGPGSLAATCNGGASHGGLGGSSADGSCGVAQAPSNDSPTAPSIMGSSGSGSRGGGLFRVNVPSGPATVNGIITMNAAVASVNGGGAGGTIYIKADTITGTGTVAATGANSGGAGGGGGIILLSSHTSNSYTNNYTVVGGSGASLTYDGLAGVYTTNTW